MPIKINSTGGGSVSIDVPSTGGTYTLTAPANNATIFTTDGGAITGNVSITGSAAITGNVAFTSNNVSIGGQNIAPSYGMKNRVINGAMVIDQRNAGASVSPASNNYYLDRWIIISSPYNINIQQNAGSVTPPPGFSNYLGITATSSTSAGTSNYGQLCQTIEGYNVADLDWGKSTAKTVTLSFWVRSSVTGTFGGSVRNNDDSRGYVISYTINSANTWEYKTITIPGDTSGTWLTTNGVGIYLRFSYMMGSNYVGTSNVWSSSAQFAPTGQSNAIASNGGTFYITGVQLEIGSVATPFEVRSFSTELALCERYFERSYNYGTATGTAGGIDSGAMAGTGVDINDITTSVMYSVPKRAAPTITMYNSATGASGGIYDWTNGVNYNVSGVGSGGTKGFSHISISGSVTTPHGYSFHWTASAEL